MRKKRKLSYDSRFRSGLEAEIADQLERKDIAYTYEEDRVSYVVPQTPKVYTPDFLITTRSGKSIFIEGKGLWDYQDRYKHYLIRRQHPKLDIRFVFSNPNQKIRKGSKTTYADICNGLGRAPFKGMKWKYSKGLIPDKWLAE